MWRARAQSIGEVAAGPPRSIQGVGAPAESGADFFIPGRRDPEGARRRSSSRKIPRGPKGVASPSPRRRRSRDGISGPPPPGAGSYILSARAMSCLKPEVRLTAGSSRCLRHELIPSLRWLPPAQVSKGSPPRRFLVDAGPSTPGPRGGQIVYFQATRCGRCPCRSASETVDLWPRRPTPSRPPRRHPAAPADSRRGHPYHHGRRSFGRPRLGPSSRPEPKVSPWRSCVICGAARAADIARTAFGAMRVIGLPPANLPVSSTVLRIPVFCVPPEFAPFRVGERGPPRHETPCSDAMFRPPMTCVKTIWGAPPSL